MRPVSPVVPGSGLTEVILAENQPQYLPLPVVRLPGKSCPMVSRWRPTHEERMEIAAGADIVLTQLTFGNLFHPVFLQTAMPDETPELASE